MHADAIRSREPVTCPWCGLCVAWNCPEEYNAHERACSAVAMWEVRLADERAAIAKWRRGDSNPPISGV